MQKVFFKATFGALDLIKLERLRQLIGDYSFEGMDYESFQPDVVVISFYTDKVEFKEGDRKQVGLVFKTQDDQSVTLERIEKA